MRFNPFAIENRVREDVAKYRYWIKQDGYFDTFVWAPLYRRLVPQWERNMHYRAGPATRKALAVRELRRRVAG